MNKFTCMSLLAISLSPANIFTLLVNTQSVPAVIAHVQIPSEGVGARSRGNTGSLASENTG